MSLLTLSVVLAAALLRPLLVLVGAVLACRLLLRHRQVVAAARIP